MRWSSPCDFHTGTSNVASNRQVSSRALVSRRRPTIHQQSTGCPANTDFQLIKPKNVRNRKAPSHLTSSLWTTMMCWRLSLLLTLMVVHVYVTESFLPASVVSSKQSSIYLLMAADENSSNPDETSVNVLGTSLRCCCADVGGTGTGTGFYRNGYCSTGEQDLGRHTVCCQVTDEFLEFSKAAGNDLSTPMPNFRFPGLKEGDIWCLCAQRWAQAYNAGKAPKIFLQATHEKTLDYAPYEVLREYAIDKDESDRVLGDLNEQRDRLNKLL
jgi:uncharacterized protein (DUF2237 family)